MSNEDFTKLYEAIKNDPSGIVKHASRRRLINFARYIQPDMVFEPFHTVYYTLLDKFAHGEIKKMIVQMPPQHGKSEGSSRKLPAYMLGIDPDKRICICSYAATIARDFNRDVQRIIDTTSYRELFPDTYLNGSDAVTASNNYLRNSDVIEMVGHKGSLRVVGRGGALTSKTIDVSILDDVYKDYKEGNSPVVRNAAWKWYTTVVRSRLHNKSQELIVFTRWHDDDLIGRIEKSGEKIVELRSWEDVKNIPDGAWLRINFEGLKTGEPTEIDPREPGEALWEDRHSRKKLEMQRSLDPVQFQCLYQGNPGSAEGKLYQNPFRTYVDKSEWGTYVRSGNYTDVADEGNDYTFSVCYDIYKSGNESWNEQKRRFEPILYALVTDMEYTQENTDVTSVTVPAMINRNGTQKAWIESNNGGSGFEKLIRKKIKAISEPFYQGANKESRIVTNSASVNGAGDFSPVSVFNFSEIAFLRIEQTLAAHPTLLRMRE